jgi:hypothetical protein
VDAPAPKARSFFAHPVLSSATPSGEDAAMRGIFAVAALCALIISPAIAQQKTSSSDANAVRSFASEPLKKVKQGKTTLRQTPSRRASPYSTNPEHDVYFRGEYVGSDPDPRIRWTLRDEARRSYGLDN